MSHDQEPTQQSEPDHGPEPTPYASRPARLRPQASRGAASAPPPPLEADGRNPAYVAWLEQQSMLHDAIQLSRQLAGKAAMWSRPYAKPDPRTAVQRASVWFTAYPLAQITASGESFLSALGGEELWEAFAEVGIDAVHTGPLKLAGGLSGGHPTPSVDGQFDRISMQLDPAFGTEDEFRRLCATAERRGGTVIDDIVPGHTGKGADFRLAELNYLDYPGIYHMVEIPETSWHLLPEVPEGRDSVNLNAETERALAEAGFIIGALQRVIFYEPGVKETNWSATGVVHDHQGVPRRWVYLHYFKEGQPTINWLDPTFAGMRLVMGDALHSLLDLGSGGLRLDANGFLGVEKTLGGPAWSEGHPISLAANQLIGSLVRKVGGFTFQELNLAIDDILATGALGPDLSYDFVTRPAYQLALATADTGFLRLALRESLAIGVDQASLVHALQNHDELTYELVHYAARHANDEYRLAGVTYSGSELAEHVRETLRQKLTGTAAPYNALFVQNGIACTTASVIAASLGITDLDTITDADAHRISIAHLLLCKYNAWQPGVIALSGWDLVGALPLPRDQVADLISTGDTRWLERGAYDLTGANPDAVASASGLPRARALYGPLPAQLDSDSSFASGLAEVLKVRTRSGIATATLLDVPEVAKEVLVLVSRLETGATAVTVLNFGPKPVSARVQSQHLPAGRVAEVATGREIGEVDDRGGFNVELAGFGGLLLTIHEH